MPVNVNEIEPDEKIVEIEMERLREFRNHPFKVKADYRTNYAKDITEMLRESYGDTVGVMESFIPFSVKVAEASAEGSSIFRYAPKCKAAESFERLTKEVLGR